jgi:hypothetical protein
VKQINITDGVAYGGGEIDDPFDIDAGHDRIESQEFNV